LTEEKKSKKKNKKLSAQVGFITLIFFLGTLVLSLPMIFTIIRKAYLKAKEECFTLDLQSIRNEVMVNPGHTSWMLSYMRENPEDFRRPLTEEENELRSSSEYANELSLFISDDSMDPEILSPEKQLLFARDLMQLLKINVGIRQETIAADVLLLDFTDDENVFIYMQDTPGKKENENGTVVPLINAGKKAKEVLGSADASEPDKVFFEMDEWKDTAYYIGLLPVYFADGPDCTVCIMYDWSSYRDLTVQRLAQVTAIGVLVLFILSVLLMALIYRKAIKPVEKIKEGVVAYKESKDAEAVSEKMEQIRERNEIGVLADSFVDMITEVDRYSRDNLKLHTEQERINTELSLATNIQSSMLPNTFPAFPDRKDFDLFASMNPAREVGGDFYNFFMIDDDHLCLMIADVSGKGIPAALFMMASMIILENQAMHGKSPAKIITEANNAICKNNKEMLFVTVWLGILELSTGRLTAVNAGHEPLAVMGEEGRFEMFEDEHSIFVGVMEGFEFTEYEMMLKPGSRIFVYTDGVPEATNAGGELFGMERMIGALNIDPKADPKELLQNVKRSVDEFVKDAEQFDDLTMLCLDYRGPEAAPVIDSAGLEQ